jgi:PhoPQ-activated pathogenicity-related protein
MEELEVSSVEVPTRNRFLSWRRLTVILASLAVVTCTATVLVVYVNPDSSDSVMTAKSSDIGNLDVPSKNDQRDGGIVSPYRYDCNEVDCTPLDDYVWRDNDAYEFKTVAIYDHRFQKRPVRTIVVNMTSQHWLTTDEVSRTLWWHEMAITIPYDFDQTMARSGLLYITGGTNKKPGNILAEDSEEVKACEWVAKTTRTIAAVLRQAPNQPLYFTNDPRKGERGRTEDDIIAWTWKHFLNDTTQPDWLLRMPMTKAARLALDTIDAVFKDNRLSMDLSHMRAPIDQFLISGASKRGWTTWTLASVDKRVKAAAPLVLDCLNMENLFQTWFSNLGGWSFALYSYYDEDITKYIGTSQFQKMASIIDPYYYRGRLTMPKLVISAGDDEFFAPDDSYAWYSEFKDKSTYLRILPNSEHGMIPPQALSSPSILHSIRAFYLSVMREADLPQISWERHVDENGVAHVTVETSKIPSLINGWTADSRNKTRRDFRWAQLKPEAVDWPSNSPSQNGYDGISGSDVIFQPIKWNRVMVQPSNERKWTVSIPPSESGFRALMVELSFQGTDDKSKLTFTTEVMITPDERPFPSCFDGEVNNCFGYLL